MLEQPAAAASAKGLIYVAAQPDPAPRADAALARPRPDGSNDAEPASSSLRLDALVEKASDRYQGYALGHPGRRAGQASRSQRPRKTALRAHATSGSAPRHRSSCRLTSPIGSSALSQVLSTRTSSVFSAPSSLGLESHRPTLDVALVETGPNGEAVMVIPSSTLRLILNALVGVDSEAITLPRDETSSSNRRGRSARISADEPLRALYGTTKGGETDGN